MQDELVQEAFGKLEDSYVTAWRNSVHTDEVGREKLYLAINILGKVRDHLRRVVHDGELAAAELEYLVKTRKGK